MNPETIKFLNETLSKLGGAAQGGIAELAALRAAQAAADTMFFGALSLLTLTFAWFLYRGVRRWVEDDEDARPAFISVPVAVALAIVFAGSAISSYVEYKHPRAAVLKEILQRATK